MNTYTFNVYQGADITDEILDSAIELLKLQEKVGNPDRERVSKCKTIIICYFNEKPVGIGAIKTATKSDFNERKANINLIEDQFDWELGYFYTDPSLRGLGIAFQIAKILIRTNNEISLMASTELFPGNPMVNILESLGFRQMGSPWKSKYHDGLLGLFIRAKKGVRINKLKNI